MADSQKRIRRHITKLVATSIIRGSRQGDSHGAVYVLDLEKQRVRRALDWNKTDIDWAGHVGDRGLRGIAVDRETVYIAGSTELYAFNADFEPCGSWRSPFLGECREIAVWERTLYLTSPAYDSVLGFDLDRKAFHWAINVQSANFRFKAVPFDPMGESGPLAMNKQQLDCVFCSEHGMYITGARSGGMLHFNGRRVNMAAQLPDGTHNARPFRDGVLFNDTEAGSLRYTGRGDGEEDRAMRVPQSDPQDSDHKSAVDPEIAQSAFARGLCVLSGHVVAGGSAPATVALYDLAANETVGSVQLSTDMRETIHSIAQWPFD